MRGQRDGEEEEELEERAATWRVGRVLMYLREQEFNDDVVNLFQSTFFFHTRPQVFLILFFFGLAKGITGRILHRLASAGPSAVREALTEEMGVLDVGVKYRLVDAIMGLFVEGSSVGRDVSRVGVGMGAGGGDGGGNGQVEALPLYVE
jgi:hypothetical protein